MHRTRFGRMRACLALILILSFGGFEAAGKPALAAPIFGESARTQFFLGTALRSFGQFQRLEGGEKELEVWTAPAIVSYALVTDATLTLVVPYVHKRLETASRTFTAAGVGDVALLGKYRFYRRDYPFGRDQMAIIGGVELPSGSTSEGPGIKAAPPLQPGSGGVDGIIGIAFGTTRSWYSIEGALRWKNNSEAKGVRFGNVLLYDLYVARQLYPGWPSDFAQLNLSLELNGRTIEDNKIEGRTADTGGTVLFLSPGVQYILAANFLLETGVQIPVIRNFPDRAIEPDYTVTLGFRLLF